jgi:hypothetical protein
MWRSSIISLIVAVLSVGVGAAEPSAQGMAGDIAIIAAEAPGGLTLQAAADPNQTWDPAAHLTGNWSSVSTTARIDRNSTTSNWSASVASSYTITDTTGLLGLTQSPTKVVATDQKGQVVYSMPVPKQLTRFYLPLQYLMMFSGSQLTSQLQPYNSTVTLPVDPNVGCPFLLSRLEWSMYALVTDTIKNVDVPFKVSTAWVDVAPNVQIQVTKADLTGSSFQYSLNVKYSSSKASFLFGGSTFLVGDQKPPAVMVTKMEVLDAQGKSIQDQASGGYSFTSGGSSSSSSSDNTTGTYSGSGNCNICGTAATIRFVVALNSYEKEIRFLLQNVPIPGLWY